MDTYTPLSMIQTEQKLLELNEALAEALDDLKAKRDGQVRAEHKLRKAQRSALFDEDCPAVSRGQVTIADRDAWVDDKSDAEWLEYNLAKVQMENAKDHMHAVREQISTMQSIASGQRTLMKLGL